MGWMVAAVLLMVVLAQQKRLNEFRSLQNFYADHVYGETRNHRGF